MLRDRGALAERLQRLRRRCRAGKPVERGLVKLRLAVETSTEVCRRRREHLPIPEFPSHLPVSEHRDQIAAAINENQVTVVCGETGSGKTTQLPKVCLELKRGVTGLIGHTQPRRIAARSIATRIASELKTEPGRVVGYKVRFNDRVGADAYVKLMTDGILLAETQGDPLLLAYDTIIIDEAHERSLNIDFLLGYLKDLLPRRPDLKLVITSATIDPERFARHFDGAPVIEVPGRTYPVEVRYQPLAGSDEDSRDRDMQAAILEAVDDAARLGPGDILVFLAGERQIRETAEALRKHHPDHSEVLPLYARLSATDQQRIFQPHTGRRIVLATNVAETSLTVPGIRYVIDPGFARISRYSYRTKVQRLPVEPISRASADQRKGRCGRLGKGVCFRLYSEDDFLARAEYTAPEIQRTNLASVILQMAALGLGDVAKFPFIDPPDKRYINDGYRLLLELGAMDAERRLTGLGRRVARLPVDPRLSRMIFAAVDEGCLSEVLVIVSGLSIQDPRERPLEARDKADAAHQPFQHESSDFLGLRKVWDYYHNHAHRLSGRKLRALCRESFLSYVRLREWHDIHQQLLGLLHDMGLRRDREPASYEQVHRAVLAGLLSGLGYKRDAREYVGARNTRFQIFPASGLVKRGPKWLMAAELVETGRLYARTVARIEPGWIETVGSHLVRRSHGDPCWDSRRGQVVADEKVTLYGLPVVSGRRVPFGPVDPGLSREIFIRHALVRGEFRAEAAFLAHNMSLIAELRSLENKHRRRDLLVKEDMVCAFFDRLIPADICDVRRFERWRKDAERRRPRLLYLDRDDLSEHSAESLAASDFPDELMVDGLSFRLTYHFDPGRDEDGVSVRIPVAAIGALRHEPFEWLVPGLLRDKIVALIKSLPKQLRRHFVPAPDFAAACLEAMTPAEGGLQEALARHLRRMTGVSIPGQAWRTETLPVHLRMRFDVVDERQRVVATGRDLRMLQASLRDQAEQSFRPEPGARLERTGLTRWDFGVLPEVVAFQQGGVELRGFPGLVDEGRSVGVQIFAEAARARDAHRAGLRRLLLLSMPGSPGSFMKRLPGIHNMCLDYAPLRPFPVSLAGRDCDGSCEELTRDLLSVSVDQAFLTGDPKVRSAEAFDQCRVQGQSGFFGALEQICSLVQDVLREHRRLTIILDGDTSKGRPSAFEDMRAQLAHLVYHGFVAATPQPWLREMPRYLKGVARRIERLAHNPAGDDQKAGQMMPFWRAYVDRLEQIEKNRGNAGPALEEFHWALEEFRISLFAQELGTRFPVSVSRLGKQWQGVEAAEQV